MSKLTGKGLAEFVKTKLGTPYVFGAKGKDGVFTISQLNFLSNNYHDMFTLMYIVKARNYIGQVCTDCSGLISWYTGKNIGSYQMYATATKKESIKELNKAPIGAVLWKQGHVGVYIGDGYCIEAKGIKYGTVKSMVSDTGFTHWLLFEDIISYDISISDTSHKNQNPYMEPTETIYMGCTGEGVKWIQWELNEAGFDVEIDGDFGPVTKKAIRTYQQSCKITVDGKVGTVTKKAFKLD